MPFELGGTINLHLQIPEKAQVLFSGLIPRGFQKDPKKHSDETNPKPLRIRDITHMRVVRVVLLPLLRGRSITCIGFASDKNARSD